MWDDLFFKSNLGLGPHKCLPYSYEAFVIAARYFPKFGNDFVENNGGFTKDEIYKRDVAGFFAHKVQETGENNIWLFTQPDGITAEQALDCYMKGRELKIVYPNIIKSIIKKSKCKSKKKNFRLKIKILIKKLFFFDYLFANIEILAEKSIFLSQIEEK